MARREVRITRERAPYIRVGTPIVMVMLGSMIPSMLPMIAQSPVIPPFGLLILLAWRLLRPELWPAWIGAPLGFFDDLISGQPLGSSVFLWTATLLAIEAASTRLLWRDYWQDWLIAAISVIFCLTGGWLFARVAGGGGTILLIVPQMVFSILLFPECARLCSHFDRWRLPA